MTRFTNQITKPPTHASSREAHMQRFVEAMDGIARLDSLPKFHGPESEIEGLALKGSFMRNYTEGSLTDKHALECMDAYVKHFENRAQGESVDMNYILSLAIMRKESDEFHAVAKKTAPAKAGMAK